MMAAGARDRLPLGLLLVFSTAVIRGVSTFVNFWAVQGTNSDAFITVRNLLVAALLVPFALLFRGDVRRRLSRVDWARLGVIGLAGGAIPFLLFFRGLQMAGSAGASTASFAYRGLFLLATVLAILFLKERPSVRALAAATAILAGNVLLLALTAPIWTDGTALVLAATVLWAGEYTLSKRVLRDIPPATVALGRMGFGGAFLATYLVASGQLGAVSRLGANQFVWLGISALLLTAFVTTWYAGLRHTDVSVATSVLVLGFPITWMLTFVAGRTSLDFAQAAGAAAVAFGVVLGIGLTSLRDTWAYLDRVVRAHLFAEA
jgi:drug/metabolite transporter (DMT)-like permease